MGRRKKTQYGRPRGRNELIAEWIKQDTGEIRCRKQISSHIQVLSNHLKNVPECMSVISNYSATLMFHREMVDDREGRRQRIWQG